MLRFAILFITIFTRNMRILLVLLVPFVLGIYEEDTPVELLTKNTFDQEVLRSNTPFIVEFYAPWCGHCKQLVPTWETLARGMGNIVRVGAVDATVETSVAQSYGIHGYPTILFFG
jgi:protein disulfide-isomerase A6